MSRVAILGFSCVSRSIALSGRTREVSEVERLELRLRNGLLLLTTSGQAVIHNEVEVDIIWIHKSCSEHLSLSYASSRRMRAALA